jgi:hypothetical protein
MGVTFKTLLTGYNLEHTMSNLRNSNKRLHEELTMTATTKTSLSAVGTDVMARVLEEGYGPGAWHGADMRAAIGDADAETAFWRPGPDRHNIAEIALHHAYHAHNVQARLTGEPPSPFLVAGDDWFALPTAADLSWPQIQALVEAVHARVGETVQAIADKRITSPLGDAERFDLVLGITGHAIYHAGQIQLIKRLRA